MGKVVQFRAAEPNAPWRETSAALVTLLRGIPTVASELWQLPSHEIEAELSEAGAALRREIVRQGQDGEFAAWAADQWVMLVRGVTGVIQEAKGV